MEGSNEVFICQSWIFHSRRNEKMRDSMFQPQTTKKRDILFGRTIENIPSVLSENIKLAELIDIAIWKSVSPGNKNLLVERFGTLHYIMSGEFSDLRRTNPLEVGLWVKHIVVIVTVVSVVVISITAVVSVIVSIRFYKTRRSVILAVHGKVDVDKLANRH